MLYIKYIRYTLQHLRQGAKSLLSSCGCVQHPEGLKIDLPFIISIDSESLSEALSESI